MIKIEKSKDDLDEIADKHWKYLKNRIGYDEPPLSNGNIPSTRDEIRAKKKELLRDIIGDDLFDHLEDIIKGNLKYLCTIADNNKHLCYFPKSKDKIIKLHKLYTKKNAQLKNILDGLKKRKERYIPPEYKAIKNKYEHKKKWYQKGVHIASHLEKKIDLENKKIKSDFDNATIRTYDVKEGDNTVTKTTSLYDLLGYDSLNESKEWNQSIICQKLGIDICPYCNRQYIYTVNKSGDGALFTTAQLDHFLPKANYPLLSFSFFNLIPSCYCCNHTKGDSTKRTIYPYEEEFGDDGTFALIDLENGKKFVDLDTNQHLGVKINAQGNLKDKVIASDEVFQLTPLYNKHQTEISDFVERFQHLSGIKKKEVIDLKLIKSNKDAENIILGKPLVLKERTFLLQKLKKDLLDELKTALEKELI